MTTRAGALLLFLFAGFLGCVDGGDAGNDASSGGGKRVFVTSALFTGDLGGAAGADEVCQSAADDAGRTGTWKAWVSTSTESAIERMADVGPWIDFNDATIFDSRAALASPPLAVLRASETGQLVQMERAWTGTTSAGTLSPDGNCLDWSNATIDEFGHAGQVGHDTTGWTDQANSTCAQSGHIYCFEQ